jgi:hypothetical protein
MKRKAFMGVLGTLFNKTSDDLADTDLKLTDDNNAELEDLDDTQVVAVLKKFDSEKVAASKAKLKENFDNGYKKAQGEVSGKIEKKLKASFEVEDDSLTGEDLIEHIKDSIPAGSDKTDLTKFTEDDLKKVPAYKKINQAHKKELTDLEAKHAQELAAEKENIAKGEVFSKVKDKALTALNGKKVLLPEDAAKKEARIQKLLIDDLKGYTFKEENGKFIPVDKDGVQLEDANGKVINFDDLVNSIIDTNFDPAPETTPPPTGPNNKHTQQQQQNQQKKVYTGTVPTSKDQYMDLLLDKNLDIDQKVALKDNYSDKFN